jgi:hypothetical protein
MTFWHSCMYEAIALAISDWGSVAIHAPCSWSHLPSAGKETCQWHKMKM